MKRSDRDDRHPRSSGRNPDDRRVAESKRKSTRREPTREQLADLVVQTLGTTFEWVIEQHPAELQTAIVVGFFSSLGGTEELDEFLDTIEDETESDWLLFMAHEWALADGPSAGEDDGPTRYVRDFVAAPAGPSFSPREREILSAVAASALTLVQVEKVGTERLVARDLLADQPVEMMNMFDDVGIEEGDVLGVRLLDLGLEVVVPSPVLYGFDPEDGLELAEGLREAISENDPGDERLVRATWIASAWLETTYGIAPADEDEDESPS